MKGYTSLHAKHAVSNMRAYTSQELDDLVKKICKKKKWKWLGRKTAKEVPSR